jgi:putative hemolysin
MDLPVLELVILIALTATSAFFTGSEIAFVALREGQLQRLEDDPKAKKVVSLARDSNRLLASVQIGVTLAGFFASATAAVSLARYLEEPLSFLGRASGPVAVVLVTIVLAYLTLIFGELVPKRIAWQRAERWARVAARPLSLVAQGARPVVWLLDRSTNVIVKALGGDPTVQREQVTEEELRDMIEAQETFTPEHRSIIEGAFEVAERTLREIVVPRGSVISVESNMSSTEVLESLVSMGRSRAPVHTGDLDDVAGIIHVRDLIGQVGIVAEHTRPATVLPESLQVLDALSRLQSARQQMAIVVNEHGGVEGIITVEDLLEEIVGEIYDEFDKEISQTQRHEDGSVTMPGSFPIHDLEDIDVELTDADGGYSTVAGYALDLFGRIPEVGDKAQGTDWTVEVLGVEDRAITKVRLVPVPKPDPEPDE